MIVSILSRETTNENDCYLKTNSGEDKNVAIVMPLSHRKVILRLTIGNILCRSHINAGMCVKLFLLYGELKHHTGTHTGHNLPK